MQILIKKLFYRTGDALYHYRKADFDVAINKNDIKLSGVSSEKECAQKCDTATNIHCRGFNYCGITNECYLTETHLLSDASTTQQLNLVCSHYSSISIF